MAQFLDLWAGRAALSLEPFDPARDKLWVIVGGLLRGEEVERLLSEGLREATEVLTRERALRRLADGYGLALGELRPAQEMALLRRLILSDPASFTQLARHHALLSERGSAGLLRLAWAYGEAVGRFENSFELEPRLARAWRNSTEGPAHEGELRVLAARSYQEQKRIGLAGETVMARLICERIEGGPGVEDDLVAFERPAWIVFDQLEAVTPLDARLWGLLGEAIRLAVVADARLVALADEPAFDPAAGVRPSVDHARRAIAFIRERRVLGDRVVPIADASAQGAELVGMLFDGAVVGPLAMPGLELWSCHDRRDEVGRVVRRILAGRREEGWRLEDIHIAVPNIDGYAGVLEELCHAAELPLVIPKGRLIGVSPSAVRLQGLMAWSGSGSSEAMLTYFTSPAISAPEIDGPGLEDFRRRFKFLRRLFKRFEEQGPFIVLGAGQTHKLSPHRIHAAMRRAQARGGLNFIEDWMIPLYTAAMHWLANDLVKLPLVVELVFDLAALERAWVASAPLRDSEATVADGIARLEAMLEAPRLQTTVMRELAEARKDDLPRPHGFDLSREATFAIEAYQDTRERLREIAIEDQFRRNQGWVEKGFVALHGRIRDAIAGARKARRPGPGMLVATELRDARLANPKVLFVLGLTAGDTSVEEPETFFDARLLDPGSLAETRWSIGKLLRRHARLFLSAPRVADNKESRPAMVLADLRRGCGRGALSGVRGGASDLAEPLPREPGAMAVIPELLRGRVDRGSAILRARASPERTAFDGAIGATDKNPQGRNEYSATMLETLADCPHRFFFAHLLKLDEFPEVRDELPRHAVGTTVHTCLERFWAWDGGPISAANFDRACAEMGRIARDVLGEPGVDWDSGPLNRHDRATIIRGLDEPGDTGPRGMLKAALAFQRDLPFLAGPPLRLEMAFGSSLKEQPEPVPITERVAARGFIDRVDLLEDEQGRAELVVIDYKTGSAKTIRDVEDGAALQIPLYALAAQRVLGLDGARLRGGLLSLREAQRRDSDAVALDHPTRGVYREHLRVAKVSGCWSCEVNQSVVDEALARFRGRLDALDTRVREGALWQRPEPAACSYCDFRDICDHDEAVLSGKLGEPEDRPPAITVSIPAEPAAAPSCAAPTAESGPRRLSDEQALAADEKRSASVTAGAGSGKTFILKTRVARLIRSGVPVSAVLAITFTDKAAEEIRERIEEALGEALEPGAGGVDGPLSAAERLDFVQARAAMDGAAISTIHAFCSRLLALDPALSGFDGAIRVADGPELEELEELALRAVCGSKSTVGPAVERLLGQGIPLSRLRIELRRRLPGSLRLKALEASLARPPAAWDATLARLRDELLCAAIEPIRVGIEEWFPAAQEWLESQAGQSVLKAREGRAAAMAEVIARVADVLEDLAEGRLIEAATALQDCLSFLDAENGAVLFRASPKNPRNYWKELRELLTEAKIPGFGTDFSAEREAIAAAQDFINVAAAAQAVYREHKRAQGLLDFEDLIERAHAMVVGDLADPPAIQARRAVLLERLRGRYRHILVDEFQDTDRVQWEILRAIVGDAGAGRTFFLVGDPKQSIYGWRHSDHRIFEEACGAITDRLGGAALKLRDNFRSGVAVLSWINGLFDEVFASEFGPDGAKLVTTAVAPQAMRAASLSQAAGSVSILVTPEKDERAEQEAVAVLLSAILAGDPRFATAPSKGPRVAVLVRTIKSLHRFARLFDSKQIPYSSSHRAGFFMQPPVLVIEAALRAIAFQQDDIAIVGLLRGPLIGWSDRDLYEAREALHVKGEGRQWLDGLRLGMWSDPRGQRLGALMMRWQRASAWCSPAALIRLIVSDTGLDIAYQSTQRVTELRDLRRLIELVEDAEREGGLVELLGWMRRQRRSESEGAAIAPADDIPVVLTTIHGAKGLEFPIVILPNLGRTFRSDTDFFELELPSVAGGPILALRSAVEETGRRAETILSMALKAEERARTRSEEKRLLYVACTRAATHLVLTRRGADEVEFEDTATRRARLRTAESHGELLAGSEGGAGLLRAELQV